MVMIFLLNKVILMCLDSWFMQIGFSFTELCQEKEKINTQ